MVRICMTFSGTRCLAYVQTHTRTKKITQKGYCSCYDRGGIVVSVVSVVVVGGMWLLLSQSRSVAVVDFDVLFIVVAVVAAWAVWGWQNKGRVVFCECARSVYTGRDILHMCVCSESVHGFSLYYADQANA